MKKFDTKKIKIKSKKEPSMEEKLTGSVISELKTDKVEPNAELEGDEIVQFPDGLIQTVKGEPHSKGGVKMNIPDGTRIISNKLTLSKKDVTRLKDKYDLNTSTNDTYAKAFDKFLKKSGITRLNEEQKGYFETLKKQLESESIPSATFRLNQEHLSKKISEIEMQKQIKEDVKKEVFNDIFQMQEVSKSPDKKAKSESGEYKYGGTYRKFAMGGFQPMNGMPYGNYSGLYSKGVSPNMPMMPPPPPPPPPMTQKGKDMLKAEKGGTKNEFNISEIKVVPKPRTRYADGGPKNPCPEGMAYDPVYGCALVDTIIYPPGDSEYMNQPRLNYDIIEMLNQKYRRDAEEYIRDMNDPTNIQRATPAEQQKFYMNQGLVSAQNGGTINMSGATYAKGGEKKSGYGNLTQSQFQSLCKKYGMTEEQGKILLLSKTKQYAKGGVTDSGDPYVVISPDGTVALKVPSSQSISDVIPLGKGEYKINPDGTIDIFKEIGALGGQKMVTAPYYYQNPQSDSEDLLTPEDYVKGDYASAAALDKASPEDFQVIQDESGNFNVVKTINENSSSTQTVPNKNVTINNDGTATFDLDGKKVTANYQVVNKETGELESPVVQVAESIDKTPKGMTKQEYLSLKKDLDSPVKIAKAYSEGKIDAETANKLQFILDNSTGALFTTSTAGKSVYSKSELYPATYQKVNEAAHGNITKEDLPLVMEYLYKNFPDIVSSEDIFGGKFDESGKFTYNESLDFTKASEQVGKFQERANDRMKATARVILDNAHLFDTKDVEEARRFLSDETFNEGLPARKFDKLLGNFTSGRYNLGVNVVSKDELQKLNALNIYTVKDLNKAIEENPELISDASKARLYELSDIMSDDSDFLLNPTVQPEAPEEEQIIDETPIVDDITMRKPSIPTRYFTPDVAPLPPTAMMPHFMGQSQFGLAEPVRIGIEQQVQATNDIMRDVNKQVQDLPPQQRALVMSQMQAERGKQLNDAAFQANVTNAQNLANTELFNIGQRDRQSEADIRNKLSFEQRQYTALANTQEEFKRYFDRLNDIRLNEYSINQNLNMLNQIYPDYSLASSGMGIDYTPEEEFRLRQANQYSQLFGNPYIP
jgi:hypothetical protein